MSMPEKILAILKRSGPQVSPKIAKEVKGEAIIVSAYLSELKAAGKVKISQMKIGSSPLYYLPGQEKRLALFADRLNSKDRAVYDTLEQLKVLREAQLDLLSKVALRKMKDFAIPMHVSVGGTKELFWRWYMLEPDETNLIVSSLLQQVGPREALEEVPSNELSTPAVTSKESNKIQNVPSASALATSAPEKSNGESDLRNPWGSEYPPNTTVKGEAHVDSVYPENTAAVTRGSVEFDDTVQAQVVEVTNTADIEVVTPSEIEIDKESVQQQISDIQKVVKEKPETKVSKKATSKVDLKNSKVTEKKTSKSEKQSAQDKQKSLVEKLKDVILPKHKGKPGDLLPKVETFFSELGILIESSEVVRKNSELVLHLLVPTNIGKVLFFCKVRRKKKCDEKDISAAYMEAQVARLPLLFLYTEEISPKAKDFLESGSFDNLLLLKMEKQEK